MQPSPSVRKLVDFDEHWECPFVNGIMFPDGTIQCLDVTVKWERPTVFTIGQGEQTSLQQLEETAPIHWTSCGVLTQLIDEPTGLKILAGESDWGSDGFVAVLDMRTRQLVWLARFDCSNPFGALAVHGDAIHATSTIGCTWTFPLHAPARCFVACGEFFLPHKH